MGSAREVSLRIACTTVEDRRRWQPAHPCDASSREDCDSLHLARAGDDAAGQRHHRNFGTRMTLGLFAADQFKC